MLEHTEDMLRVSKQRVREQNLCILALEVSLLRSSFAFEDLY